MKKIFIAAAAIIASAAMTTVSAEEKGVYLNANFGYAFAAGKSAGEVLGYQFGTSHAADGTVTSEYISLGEGMSYSLGAGYKVNKYLAFELNANILGGSKARYSDTTTEATLKMNSVSLAPLLRFKLPVTDTFSAYTKLGLNITAYNSGIMEVNEGGAYKKYKLKGRARFGSTASIGGSYKLNDSIDLYGELSALISSFAPKSAELKEYTVSGVNVYDNLSYSQKHIDFKESYNESSNSSDNLSTATSSSLVALPATSVALKIGVCYNF